MPLNAFAILSGTWLAFYGNQLIDLYWVTLLPILLWLAFCNPGYRFLLLLLAAHLWAGAVLHHHLEYRLAADFDNRISLVRGIVTDIPEIDSGRVRISLSVIAITGYQQKLPRLIRLNWYQDKVIPGAGEMWQFEAKLKRPDGLSNPGAFDFEAWQFVKGIDARGYIRNSKLNQRLAAAPVLSIDRWRYLLARQIENNCAQCTNLGVIKALALGYRGDISSAQAGRLQATGTAHLIAISGLHIGIIAALFYTLGRWLWRLGLYSTGMSRNLTASLLAMFAAVIYAALAGFSLPTVRALVMFAVLFFARLFKNRVNILQSLSLTLILILVVDPRVVGSASFWLSVSAVLIIAFAQFRFDTAGIGMRLLVLQISFSLIFIPAGILIFGQINPASFVANVVAIPLISIAILPLILAASFLASTGISLAQGVFTLCDLLLDLLMRYLDLLLTLGLDSISAAHWPQALSLLLIAWIFTLLMPAASGARKASLLLLPGLIFWQPEKLEQGEYELTVFDVGMGTSILIRTRHHSLVYDFGPGRANGFSAADWGLLPYLRRQAIEMPDLLVVSHVDQDHSGGFQSFLGSYQPAQLLSGTAEELRRRFGLTHRVRSCHGYDDWRWDGVQFRFLSLAPPRDKKTNNRSCVLKIDGYQRALLPGDIESKQEARLIQHYASDLAAEILIAPHHGSATSSSQAFVDQVKPDHVVFTLSRGNRWGFPRAPVVERYERIGSYRYRSDTHGAIRLLSTQSGILATASRRVGNRIWRRW